MKLNGDHNVSKIHYLQCSLKSSFVKYLFTGKAFVYQDTGNGREPAITALRRKLFSQGDSLASTPLGNDNDDHEKEHLR